MIWNFCVSKKKYKYLQMGYWTNHHNIFNKGFLFFVFLNGFYLPICHIQLDNKLSTAYKHCVTVWHCVCILKEECAKPFQEYLRSYYIKDDSPFSPSYWAGLKFKTTNNGAESFHRHFGDLFGYLHTKPDIWELLRTMAVYNVVYKDTKINSKEKKSKKISDFWSTPIEQCKDKEISIVKFFDSLSNN